MRYKQLLDHCTDLAKQLRQTQSREEFNRIKLELFDYLEALESAGTAFSDVML